MRDEKASVVKHNGEERNLVDLDTDVSKMSQFCKSTSYRMGRDSSVGIATELRAGRSGDRIPVGARFSAPVQTGPGAHPASCTRGTGSFLGVKSGRGVTLTSHPFLVPWSRKSRAIPLLPLWAIRPVQNLSSCTRVHFTLLTFTLLEDHGSTVVKVLCFKSEGRWLDSSWCQ